ncbi:hypothetical protein D791_01593 [Nitrincola nitratireducens]|uniref:Uncharacterized protein n=1 Tax=Nitrincola nitratireducens TaxID=1229521 RepID=W9V3E5_9GAMM|nr:hypothetical protein D791_01593 [Nitrincola nitratireducens]
MLYSNTHFRACNKNYMLNVSNSVTVDPERAQKRHRGSVSYQSFLTNHNNNKNVADRSKVQVMLFLALVLLKIF